jgi:hypothetical protein
MPAESRTCVVTTSHVASGWVVVHPRVRDRFKRRGLVAASDFLDLPGEVVSGHPDRHVVRVVLGRGPRRLVTYLKREHRIPWLVRLANFRDGFGWMSKSEREARVLHELRRAGIAVPRWLAFGADGQGRAFVLVQAVRAVDLRTFLHRDGAWSPAVRRELAGRLGEELARVHSAGFDCPDLSSKHVLVHRRGLSITLIDWQRTRRSPRVRWPVRLRELATLHATLADDLASPRDRFRCLRAYLKACLGNQPALRDWVHLIVSHSRQLLARRYIRELRRPPLAASAQRLRWVDGESLVVTRAFWQECRGLIPDWLTAAADTPVDRDQELVRTWRGRRVVLRQFSPATRLKRFWNRLRGRHEVAPGPRLGGLFFRQERMGVPGPRPLAFGQRPDGGSFILLQPAVDGGPRAHD